MKRAAKTGMKESETSFLVDNPRTISSKLACILENYAKLFLNSINLKVNGKIWNSSECTPRVYLPYLVKRRADEKARNKITVAESDYQMER